MAKQKGIIKINGTIGDMTFAKTRDGYIVKEKTSLSGKRMASDPAFQRTRENMSEFGHAGKAGKILRNAIRTLLMHAKDGKVVSRLTKEMMKVLQADATSVRGERNVIDGETELLQGFDFNINSPMTTTLYAPYVATINRVTGELKINIPAFSPTERVVAPDGTTHFKIVSCGAEVDFENEKFTVDEKNSAVLPWNDAATAVQELTNVVTANSTHPLFLLLGVQFFQFVNGVQYPLKNESFNALAIVQVSGV